MKLFSCFVLAATAIQAQQGDSQGVQQGDQGSHESYGGEAVESYGGEVAQSYATPDATTFEAFRPEICVASCPFEAPFFNANTGVCQPGICRQEVAYNSAPVQTWGGQQSGYRKLQQAYGQQAYGQQAYGAPAQQSYGAVQNYGEVQEVPECNLEAPHGTIDTRNNRLTRSGIIALWIGFACLFLSSVYFVNRYLWFYYLSDRNDAKSDWRIGSEANNDVYEFLAQPSLICGMVTFIASLAYLAMATRHGFYTRCFDGREFFYARYLDWVITTPMMLHALAYIGNMEDNIWHYLFFCDILMIISGLVGSTVGGSDKWAFFGFSVLCFLPVIYYLCERKNRTVDNRIFDDKGGVVANLIGDKRAFQPFVHFIVGYSSIMRLTVCAWVLYPVVWILAEGTGTISANGEAIFYTVLDIISKAGFGMLVVTMRRNNYTQAKAAGYKFHQDGKNWSDEAVIGPLVPGGMVNGGTSSSL